MAGFQTHITISTSPASAYGVWGYYCGAPAGNLPAGRGAVQRFGHAARPRQRLRPAGAGDQLFAAAFVPDADARPLCNLGWSHETMVWRRQRFMPSSASAWREFSSGIPYTAACGTAFRRACMRAAGVLHCLR